MKIQARGRKERHALRGLADNGPNAILTLSANDRTLPGLDRNAHNAELFGELARAIGREGPSKEIAQFGGLGPAQPGQCRRVVPVARQRWLKLRLGLCG